MTEEEIKGKEWTGERNEFDVYWIGNRGKLHLTNDRSYGDNSLCGRVEKDDAQMIGKMLLPKAGVYRYNLRSQMDKKVANKFCKQCVHNYYAGIQLQTAGTFTHCDTGDTIYACDIKWEGENADKFKGIIKGKPTNKKVESPKIVKDDMFIKDSQLEKATAIILQGIDTNKIVDLTKNVVLNQIAEHRDRLEKHITQEVAKNVKTLEVKPFPEAPKIEIENTHKDFEKLMGLLSGGMNVLMVGPSGSFKTTSARMAAEAFGKNFAAMSLGPTITESKVFGYQDVSGNYITTAFRESYEKGGVFLFDEFDAGHPSVLVTLNAALENGFCQFPDKMVERHPDFVCIASANTFGRGADRVYSGRSQIDGATMERFVVLEWDYDTDLEHTIAGDSDWVYNVQSIRQACDELKIRHIVSPRASITGARLLKSGHFEKKEIEEMLIWKGLDRDTVLKVKRRAKEIYRDLKGDTTPETEAGEISGENPFA